jgi:DNA invertase Pin-like site-specific DNA recombinase
MSGEHLGYARVSTQKESLELQLDALRAAGCARVWSDVGTGQHARSGLTEVLQCLRSGDTLTVQRLDRIGRRTGELIRLVADLAARDIGVRSLTEPIDTTTPSGRMILDALAVFAQTEANVIREKAPTPASTQPVPMDDMGAGPRSLPPPTLPKLIGSANSGQV